MNHPRVKTIQVSFFTFPTTEVSQNQSYPARLQLTSATWHSGELECLSSLRLAVLPKGFNSPAVKEYSTDVKPEIFVPATFS